MGAEEHKIREMQLHFRHRSDLHLVRHRLNEVLQMEATLATSEEIFDLLFSINRLLGSLINGYDHKIEDEDYTIRSEDSEPSQAGVGSVVRNSFDSDSVGGPPF